MSVKWLYLSFFQGGVDIFILLVFLQFCLHQDLTNMHDFLHSESKAFHWVAEFLLKFKTPRKTLLFAAELQNLPSAQTPGLVDSEKRRGFP